MAFVMLWKQQEIFGNKHKQEETIRISDGLLKPIIFVTKSDSKNGRIAFGFILRLTPLQTE